MKGSAVESKRIEVDSEPAVRAYSAHLIGRRGRRGFRETDKTNLLSVYLIYKLAPRLCIAHLFRRQKRYATKPVRITASTQATGLGTLFAHLQTHDIAKLAISRPGYADAGSASAYGERSSQLGYSMPGK